MNTRWRDVEGVSNLADGVSIFAERLYAGRVTFQTLCNEYLADPKIQRQATHEKKANWVTKRFVPYFGGNTPIKSITQGQIESYLEARLKDKGYLGSSLKISTTNRELACIKHMFTWGTRRGYLENNPARFLQQEPEDNVRDEILEPDQYISLQDHTEEWLQPINQTAYYTAMREGEILYLTWPKVDLKKGFIRLTAEDTKTKEGRIIPLTFTPALLQLFRDLFKNRPLHTDRVFLRNNQPIGCIRSGFERARTKAGITNFRFHDLRHTAITNMRRAGIDHLTIMKITGHKTMVCFTRYNSFREPDLLAAANLFHTYATLRQNTPSTTLLPSGTETSITP